MNTKKNQTNKKGRKNPFKHINSVPEAIFIN